MGNLKTKHGTSARSPAGVTYPRYDEISTADVTFYKWSNDNDCYTELAHAGVVEVDDGILAFFAGERPALDSSLTGAHLNMARNVGFVKVGKDVADREVLSGGGTSTGGYYGFNGRWHRQVNRGINFLTSFSSLDESVSRLKTARIADGLILLSWEIWSSAAYRYSQCMLVDDDGAVVQGPWTVGYGVRLAIQDDLRVVAGRAVAYAGTTDGRIIRYELCGGGECPTGDVGQVPAATPVPTAISFTYYTKARDRTCGACGKSNAVRSDGRKTWTKTSRSSAREVCGAKCSREPSCAGFVYREGKGRCYYLKDVTCQVRAKNKHDCYTKVS